MQDSLRSARLHWIPRKRLQQVKLQVIKLEITVACLYLLGNALLPEPSKAAIEWEDSSAGLRIFTCMHSCVPLA